MTRAERLTEQEVNARDALKATQQRLAQLQAAQRTEAKKTLARRQQVVGKLAHETGLLAWDNATLRELFLALATLLQTQNPIAVLDALLADGVGPALEVGDGTAHLAVVSALRADDDIVQ